VTTSSSPVWQYRTRKQTLLRWLGWFWLVALTVFCWQLMNENTIWAFVSDAPAQAADIGSRMFPPAWSYVGELWQPLWDTINIATLGTLLGIMIAVPVAFLAASNTTPSVRFVRPLALLIIVASRSINALIWALLLVAIIGPGLLAGIIAIGLRSIGFVAKLLYEAIEEIDVTQVEAVRATGASEPRSSTTPSCPRSCQPSGASAYSGGTSTSGNPPSSVWLAPVAWAFSSMPHWPPWPGIRSPPSSY